MLCYKHMGTRCNLIKWLVCFLSPYKLKEKNKGAEKKGLRWHAHYVFKGQTEILIKMSAHYSFTTDM